ncbi:guanosine-3',5'-bis(diphosphate) 3'-pyrophosphohydrolase [Borreliella yangtzensis]|uniref:guanosine-3',5'-bis(diphosphate) 3'-pyrophosphohydrolase n=1 Tax=Borreliella yangtzensis TaxID=683292 RepID=UPI002647C55D|nr:guanosine-3',5'-bis(diphosphate) 3'-pyrophosphohydrolase [Borreliella yangtzensis]WKC75026.1 guanosine-3',5'-bis(diphosphate) 3'-pyrophosphohydrolase [Borreliella yangtzensis]
MIQAYEIAHLIKINDLEKARNIFKKTVENTYNDEFERKSIFKALEIAEQLHYGQYRESGEPYIIHPIMVSLFLAKFQLDFKATIAGLLHDVLEDTNIEKEEIVKEFDEEILSLIDGVTKIHDLHNKTRSIKEANTISKMFFAMTHDIRIIIIKLADKLHNMTTLSYLPKNRQDRIAKDCLSTYVPIAERLGISSLKTYLEDLSFKHLYPKDYKEIKNFLSETKIEREKKLYKGKLSIEKELQKSGIEAEITVRSKHFYSIFRKMQTRTNKLTQIFDTLGIRIICKKQKECYEILEIVHRVWKPIPGRLKDYIASPKENKYQSLHTTVRIPEDNQLIEIQIRTEEMDRIANYGVAAHWIYKEQIALKTDDLSFINRIKKWQQESANKNQYSMNDIHKELLNTFIYVYTPEGEVVELPFGSNSIDFAYIIHTDIGDQALYAKINGKISSITKPLKNEQIVEIFTSKDSKPDVIWLNSVRTKKARSKIRSWLNKNDNTIFVDNNIIAYLVGANKEQRRLFSLFKAYTKNKIKRIAIDPECNPTTGEDIIGIIHKDEIIVHNENCQKLKYYKKNQLIEVEWEATPTRKVHHIILLLKELKGIFSYLENIFTINDVRLISEKIEDCGNGHGITNIIVSSNAKNIAKIISALKENPNILQIMQVEEDIKNYDN